MYCTQQDILNSGISEKELSELTSDTPGVIDPNVVTAAIKKADDEINGYVAVKYAVPLSPVPSLVNTWSITIAKYHLFEGREQRLGGIPEGVKDSYEKTIGKLKDAARGLLSLGQDPPPPSKSTGQPGFEANVETPERDFTKDSMKGL